MPAPVKMTNQVTTTDYCGQGGALDKPSKSGRGEGAHRVNTTHGAKIQRPIQYTPENTAAPPIVCL